MRGAIPPLPHKPLWHPEGQLYFNLSFTFTFTFTSTFTSTFTITFICTFIKLYKKVECISVMTVLLQDFQVAEEFGVSDFPSLVYFEDEVPNVFEGKISNVHFLHISKWHATLL
jgi:hypothetical protein